MSQGNIVGTDPSRSRAGSIPRMTKNRIETMTKNCIEENEWEMNEKKVLPNTKKFRASAFLLLLYYTFSVEREE